MQYGNPRTFLASGTGSMGSTTDRASKCRYKLGTRYVPLSLEASFAGGTGSATFTLYVDYMDDNNDFVFSVYSVASIGTGGTTTIDKHWTDDERGGYVFAQPQHQGIISMPELVLDWTNPNTQTWKLALTLAEVIA